MEQFLYENNKLILTTVNEFCAKHNLVVATVRPQPYGFSDVITIGRGYVTATVATVLLPA